MRIYRHVTANELQLKPLPFKWELSMEAYLIENEGVLALDEEAYCSVQIVNAEVSLKGGRASRNSDGRVDILATYNEECIAIIELKLGELTQQHRQQLEEYLSQREQIRQLHPKILSEAVTTPRWVGVLVGASIDPQLAEVMRSGCVTSDGTPLAALTVQRFRGPDGTVIVTTDVYFKRPTTGLDYTQYRFLGQSYGKGPLALAVVKRYVEDHPQMTFAEVEKAFSKKLQGSLGVIAIIEKAEEIEARDRARHFLKAEQRIQLTDATIAVCSQWGKGNIDRLIDQARTLGYTITPE